MSACWRLALALWIAFSAASTAAQSSPVGASSAPQAATAAGSKSLFAVEIRTGPQWNAALPPNQQPMMREHSINLRRLRDEGRVRLGARYGEVGLIVLEASSLEEARAWMDADPAMRGGVFRYEIQPLTVIFSGAIAR
ncbi:MAG: YciI family protein [Pseudomonadota bacterium]